MKTIKIIFLLATLLLFKGEGFSQGWDLVWSDEFNYSGLPDGNKWSFEVHGPGWVNNERQNYTDRRLENCRVENGHLVIEARRDWFAGQEYSSARIRTANHGDWLYGRVEVRAKLPAGRGTWPAIWMLPTDWAYGGWPASGEIDIMEYVGYQPDVVHASVHTRDRNFMLHNNFTVEHWNGTVEEQFHLYALEWRKDRLDFFIDDVKYATFTNNGAGWTSWPFDKRFHLIMNLAIGGDWGGAQGIDNNIFPTRMEVDYVRIFKESSTPPGVTNLSGTYHLQNRHSGLYMDVASWSNNEGANILQWNFHGGANQQYDFTHLGNGVYKITAKHSGKSLDVANVSTANGANIQQWSYGGGTNQQFIVRNVGNGYYTLTAKNSGKLVEVGGWSTQPGGNVQQWQNNNQESGHWKLVPVTPAFNKLIQAESYSAMAGVQTENTNDAGGGQNVGWIDAGDWMAYNSINIPASGNYTVQYRVASQYGGGKLSLDLNAGSVQLGAVSIPSTGGWQTWTTVSQTVYLNAGTYNFGIYAQAGGWNINWFSISRQGAGAKMAQASLDDQIFSETSFEIYPNPADKELFIRADQSMDGGTIQIFDQLGVKVLDIAEGSERIDISSLAGGIYVLVYTRGEEKIIKKFAK